MPWRGCLCSTGAASRHARDAAAVAHKAGRLAGARPGAALLLLRGAAGGERARSDLLQQRPARRVRSQGQEQSASAGLVKAGRLCTIAAVSLSDCICPSPLGAPRWEAQASDGGGHVTAQHSMVWSQGSWGWEEHLLVQKCPRKPLLRPLLYPRATRHPNIPLQMVNLMHLPVRFGTGR